MRAVCSLLLAALCLGGARAWTDAAQGLANFRPAAAGQGNAKITLLKDAAAATGAVCLDGSPPAYYHVPGTGDGVNKWYVHHQGGGWCESMDDCLGRSKQPLGSSTKYPPVRRELFARARAIVAEPC
eukprot:SAG31_NODE_651_length_13184_cov_4.999541_2_plen_127_part_00